jgi:outer membrane protein OmpA-like peptidoglycan-associated protein
VIATLPRELDCETCAPPVPAPPEATADLAALPAVPERLAALPPALRAQALGGMQRGDGNAAVARILGRAPAAPLAREGAKCKCGGTIGADGQCDRCRAMRAAGLEPDEDAEGGDRALARLLAANVAARTATLARDDREGDESGGGEEACTTRCGGIPAACPPSFCCPFPLGTATIIREQIRNPFLVAIGSQVTASVVPVWLMWFQGGAGMQNFSGRFGSDFAADPTTVAVAGALAQDVAADIDATQLARIASTATPGTPASLLPALPGGYPATKTAELERPGPLLMDFNTIGTAPGNLAGGVGKTQTTCSVGATPSPADDARILTDVKGTTVRNPDGSITVTPTLHFKVVDTVDLCPGNCGSDIGVINEQLATIPMSRLEASGVSGDVPFFVEFSTTQAPFTVPPPAPPVPQHVVVTASTLFEFASHRLTPEGEQAILDQLGDQPSHADLTQPFVVEGHTDSKGSDETNQALSDRRAATVVALLERHYPNLAGRLTPVGHGETRPIAPNDINGVDNPAGRAQNRRVEMRFSAPPAP